MLQSIFSDVDTHKSAIIYKKNRNDHSIKLCLREFASRD